MKNGIVVDVAMVTYGLYACMTAMTTKAVKMIVQLITRYDKLIVLAK